MHLTMPVSSRVQEQGQEFLPMEHRIRRDWQSWRQHLKQGKLLGYNSYLESHREEVADAKFPLPEAPQAYQPMTSEAEGFHPNHKATGLFNVDAVESVTLQRSNSVAY